ncbi:hypothetical protein [Dokdonella sp.]|uniref:hypothetical protein n=1 Tax=Dokdonella sp. TaxID=2291710 RepID=UPI001B0A020E|nr:hypothetical protein [Dokdonella sp.]MBO9661309.1 hypothetical protein [Dokdonella sp.]
MRAFDTIRRNGADAWNLFVLPLSLALLPWSLSFRAARLLAQHARLFRAEADAAWTNAAPFCADSDEGEWKFGYRLVRWVERIDTFLTLTRSPAWWRRRVDVTGDLPPSAAPGMLLTFHWGAGHWLWRLFVHRGIRAHFLARRPQALDHGRGRVALWYAQLRGRALRRIGSLGVLYTGGSAKRVAEALAAGEGVVGMLDLPAEDAQRAQRVPLLGRVARLPSGLLEIARAQNAPVRLLSCGLDTRSGRRLLQVEELPPALSVHELLARYGAHLEGAVRRAPEAWQMWHVAPLIFVAEDSSGAA